MLLTKFLLGAFLVTLTLGPQYVAAQSAWPCPEPEDIVPCVCSYTEGEYIDMDCSGVLDDAQLEQALSGFIPFKSFRKFTILGDETIDKRVHITKLDRNTFKNTSFAQFEIVYTDLADIAPDTFFDSIPDLNEITITDSFISYFPFDMLPNCPNMSRLRVDRNNLIHMSHIRSTSLVELGVSYNPSLQYEDNAFYEAPNLEEIFLEDIGLTHIAPDTFYYQLSLHYLDLSHNELEVLLENALRLSFTPAPHTEQVKVDGNKIHTVMPSAISGLQEGTVMWMQHNNLTDLPQEVWEPVLQEVMGTDTNDVLHFDDNPLKCECNILWLVKEPNYMTIISDGTMCKDGTLLSEIDQEFLEANCPPVSR